MIVPDFDMSMRSLWNSYGYSRHDLEEDYPGATQVVNVANLHGTDARGTP